MSDRSDLSDMSDVFASPLGSSFSVVCVDFNAPLLVLSCRLCRLARWKR